MLHQTGVGRQQGKYCGCRGDVGDFDAWQIKIFFTFQMSYQFHRNTYSELIIIWFFNGCFSEVVCDQNKIRNYFKLKLRKKLPMIKHRRVTFKL